MVFITFMFLELPSGNGMKTGLKQIFNSSCYTDEAIEYA
jgi:hypothetical protein